jgi:hypothetical protein
MYIIIANARGKKGIRARRTEPRNLKVTMLLIVPSAFSK